MYKPGIRCLAVLVGLAPALVPAQPQPSASMGGTGEAGEPREGHLAELRQLTFGGENAEAYWSPDGTELVFQTTRAPYQCDQIFTLPVSDPAALSLVSTGTGRTTCGYFTADGERVIFASTHAESAVCPVPPDRSRGYVWPIYSSYDIYSAARDGSDLRQLTRSDAYDAEATVCSKDGSIVFTSTRDGDLELYRMNADGSEVKRLTEAPGYDGGAFFSPDCAQIVWRASRPTGAELEEYQALLAEGLVRPGELELWVANADGSDARQVTYLGGANFAPFFFPSGERIIFSSNHHDPQGREFDLFAVDVSGANLERITYSADFDGFPMFSPDGTQLAFASNRNQAAPGDTNVFVARWVETPAAADSADSPADRFLADVAWLADDAREGRGLGTAGLAVAADWLEQQFRAIGLEPAGDDGTYRQRFDAVVAVERDPAAALSIGGEAVPADDFMVPEFAPNEQILAPVVFAGFGIASEEHGIDDYAGLDVAGKIVLVRRYTPTDGVFEREDLRRRLGDLRYKAFTARSNGAVGLLVADLPPESAADQQETPLPVLRPDSSGGPTGDAGIPVAVLKRRWAERLLEPGGGEVELATALIRRTEPVENILGRLPAAHAVYPGSVVLGAHYDHLGFGGSRSLAPDVRVPHNGADDNASGTAALLEAARVLVGQREALARDVLFAAFTGEEYGLLGSSELTRRPPDGLAPTEAVAMLNMDMVGRLRNNRVSIIGESSADEWRGLIDPLCAALAIGCQLGGDGYGPSDQTPFYAAGVPVLHFFTGAHGDYHKPSDTTDLINAAGGARIAHLVAALAAELAQREALTYQASQAPAPVGDPRGYGASLGTIPDYADDGAGGGMLLAGVRAGGPADQAGMQRGDRIVELAGETVGDIYDLMYVLQEARPGQETTVVVERGGERLTLPVTFGSSQR